MFALFDMTTGMLFFNGVDGLLSALSLSMGGDSKIFGWGDYPLMGGGSPYSPIVASTVSL